MSERLLHVASDLALPREIATQKQAILAMSGAGKSNTAVVLAEEMYASGIPWVVIDPKGDWWGIRASVDGKGDGLPIPVLGGLNGDLPLDPHTGATVANFIAEQRATCVLDVSEFETRQDLFRFLADFATTLLRHNRLPLHIFAEEADDYLPQKPGERGELPRCLGAWQRLVKRGRFRGIGSTLITQRSSAINKDVLNMTDTLIAMRMTAPLDHKAIRPWITERGVAADLIADLPNLADGEAWIWSPQKLKLVRKVAFRRRTTFDSGATPDLLDAAELVTQRAEVDLDALKEQMSATIERSEANDPKVLHARIRELEQQVGKPVRPEIVNMKVPVVPDWVREHLDEEIALTRASVDAAQEVVIDLLARLERLNTRRNALDDLAEVGAVGGVQPFSAEWAPAPTARESSAATASTGSVPLAARKVPSAPTNPDGVKLGKRERSILTVLARYPQGRTEHQIALLTGYSPKASTIGAGLSALRKAGFVDGRVATEAGIAWLGDYEPLPTGRALYDYWLSQLGARERALLTILVDCYPRSTNQAEMAEITGYSAGASTIGAGMSRLRGFELATGWRASDDFMEAIR